MKVVDRYRDEVQGALTDLIDRQPPHLVKRQKALTAQSVVYYIRIGDRVKIGYTTNIRARCTGLRVDVSNVLATEPGGRTLEHSRHQQFAAERVGRREDFNPSPLLLDHIEQVKRDHGPPRITTYPHVA